MNVRVMAALILAEKALEDLERTLKRQNDRRSARKVAEIRTTLARAMTQEQEGLSRMIAELQTAEASERTAQS